MLLHATGVKQVGKMLMNQVALQLKKKKRHHFGAKVTADTRLSF